ncbi:Mg chelatase-related protein [Mycolicibacterium rhodesiae NBB3]|uniref:Mg chelatase-related protein n=1 Tax=Mycolicibacterium rhodesiae (strain NBB3) TaxID=710685 RepID=G8RN54_MYCRN|nr:YifB family Mg chelatase-like AAA ATPase [Mycolicibacterium rhodesiae]AEV76248.1 Mg chelatase-related protein [Mycolicibacterium rhodesiae NBB3]
MALGRAFSVAVRGLDGHIVEIEADITSGLPGVHLVGLPDAALQESRDRVRAAITNCGSDWPQARLTLALSPATLPKMGSVYDIALAMAVMSAHGKAEWNRLEKTVLLGELALDGRVRPVKGVLPAVLAAKREGWPLVVVPVENLAEAALVHDIDVKGVRTLGQLKSWIEGKGQLEESVETPSPAPSPTADLADVIGQTQARYAVEVAAAGAHHLMLTGPPGIGKTMLAQWLPGLLPTLTESEALEVTAIHSVAGLLSGSTPLITRPPFVAPHHTSSVAAMVGGGSGMARPGAVSRAHRGVLFLDECAEIGVSVMEALRTPLEDGEIRLARRDGVARYPARFQLVLAANPCPCAPADPRDCICPGQVKRRYLGKLSGPLLDRVDLVVEMHPQLAGAFAQQEGESTAAVCQRVATARQAAAERWGPYGIRTNAEVSGSLLRKRFRLPPAVMKPLSGALDRKQISMRGADRSLRVAWTLADLAGRTSPVLEDVSTALSFRQSGGAR